MIRLERVTKTVASGAEQLTILDQVDHPRTILANLPRGASRSFSGDGAGRVAETARR